MSSNNQVWKLKGSVNAGITWASKEWDQIVVAHRTDLPDIADYYRGTLNVVLTEHWNPPDDERHRRASHKRGIAGTGGEIGAGLLANGNYIHPQIQVLSINGIQAEGRLYFPGISDTVWRGNDAVWGTLAPVGRIEIISKTRLRTLLGIGSDEVVEVEVELG